VREVRWDCLWLRQSCSGRQALPEVPVWNPLLVAADEALLANDRAKAAEGYRQLLAQADLPAGVRLDAWAGLMQSAPVEALDELPKVITKDTPDDQVAWVAWHLAEETETAGEFTGDQAANWLPKAAVALQGLIARDPGYMLAGADSRHFRALRVPAAIVFHLAGQPEKATAILRRPVTFQMAAPPGGWRNPPRTPPPADAGQARRFSSPEEGDVAQWDEEVAGWLKQFRPDLLPPRAAARQ